MSDPKVNICNVAIYDDETDRAIEWKKDLEDMGDLGLSIRVPTCDQIQGELDQLYKRRYEVDQRNSFEGVPCSLDDVDILILDYDLRLLSDHRGFATGEEIAYAARLFSKVKLIVVVNHPDIGLNNFDLTLQRDRNLKADLYIGQGQIANPGLWRRDPGHDGFVPWNWPVLLEDVVHFDTCVGHVRDNLSAQLLPYFGFDRDESRPSPEMMAFLGVFDPRVTLAQIIEVGNPAPFVRPKDKAPLLQNRDRLSRVVTATLWKWLRRWILPPQTILADAPHLASTVPWSLKEPGDPSKWTGSSTRGALSDEVMSAVFRPEVTQHRFQRPEWIGTPTFYIQAVRQALEGGEEPLKSFDFSKVPPLVFAEDLSRFIPVEEAVEYDVTLDGQPQVRAVCKQDTVALRSRQFDPASVIYVPQSMMV